MSRYLQKGYEVVRALRGFALQKGTLNKIVAIGNTKTLPKEMRDELQDSGVSMHDVSSTRANASDIALLVEILKLVLDDHPPHCIILISGDIDFSKVLHVLVGRKYTVRYHHLRG
jgi:hypothetical protein